MKLDLKCPWCKKKILYDFDVYNPNFDFCCEPHKKYYESMKNKIKDRLDELEGPYENRWELLDL